MTLNYKKDDEVFILKCNYDEKNIPKDTGFHWCPDKKFWFTKDVDVAAVFSGYANDTTLDILVKKLKEIEESGDEI